MQNFLRLDDKETSETGDFPWLAADLFTLASEIGVILPTDLGAVLTEDLEGTDSLLGGFADFSLPEKSRTATLLLTFDVGLPLDI